jgi:hypothetical protein
MADLHAKGTDTFDDAWYSSDWHDKRRMLWRERVNFVCGKHSLVALASDHYSAASTAASHDGLIWKMRAVWCGGIALMLALVFYLVRDLAEASVNELDVLQSIFRAGGLDQCAKSCIDTALARNLAYHTPATALLWAAKVRLLAKQAESDHEKDVVVDLLQEKVLVHCISDYNQRARVHKNVAITAKMVGKEDFYARQKEKALEIAKRHDIEDQIVKIKAI